MELYTLSGIQSMLGLSRTVITGLIDAGFVTPSRGPRREYRFSFQDVVLLRTAHSLQAAKIPPRRILSSLQQLRSSLPDELPLSGLRIAAVGNDIAVRDGNAQWNAESGQMLIDFEIRPAGSAGSVSLLSRKPETSLARTEADSDSDLDSISNAQGWFDRGVQFESDGDPVSAERAYREAIRLAPTHVDAYLNLGVLLGHAGRTREAIDLGVEALTHRPFEALLHFNLAVAMEDAGRDADALARYEACLKLAPDMADAHFNAARLHEQAGHATKAIRHYNEYRRLQP